jgi:hypothetical protein
MGGEYTRGRATTDDGRRTTDDRSMQRGGIYHDGTRERRGVYATVLAVIETRRVWPAFQPPRRKRETLRVWAAKKPGGTHEGTPF